MPLQNPPLDLRTPDLQLYQLDANTMSLENIAGGTFKTLKLGGVLFGADSLVQTRANNAGKIDFQVYENGAYVTAMTLQSNATAGYAGVKFGKHVAIGDAAPTIGKEYLLRMYETITVDTSLSYQNLVANSGYAVTSGPYAGSAEGVFGNVAILAANTQNWTATPVGVIGTSGNVTVYPGSSGTITGVAAFHTCLGFSATGANVTNLYGMHLAQPTTGTGKIANSYALYIENWNNVGNSTNYAIYSPYDLPFYFGGDVNIIQAGTGTQSTIDMFTSNDQLGYCPQLRMHKNYNDVAASLTATPNDEIFGQIRFYGVRETSPAYVTGAYIQAIQNGAATASRVPTDLEFYTSDDTDAAAIALTIGNDKNITIATGVLKIGANQVVGARVVDARCDDAIAGAGAYDDTTAGVIDALRDAMIAHGLIAAA